MWIPASAPMAKAVRSVSTDLAGPMVIAVMDETVSLAFSRSLMASSTAESRESRQVQNEHESLGFDMSLTDRSHRRGSIISYQWA
jgi:hypothetical protein